MERVAVLIPARDEAACLPGLLDRLDAAGIDRTVVVDNGSTDGTAAIAARRGAVVVTAPRPGYGRACLAGIGEIGRWSAPPAVLVFMDADDLRAPGQIRRLVDPILEGRADLVIGERRFPAGEPGVRIHARLGNALATAVLRRCYGGDVRDLGPFRAIRLSCLRHLELDDKNYGWYVQMQARALRAGCRVMGVPVEFRARQAGRSKVSGSVTGSVRAGAKILTTLSREIVRGSGRARHSA
ncbi:MAG: glycosyltransferase [Gemmatimonadota bacterium]|nr:MAG: glycosyltransferase [Gemmatimonadota bacterium]